MKQGRPTNPESKKGRTHSALLSVKSELILRKIKKQRPEFNFSQYVSRRILDDFGTNTSELAALRLELASLHGDVSKKEGRMQEVMIQIKDLQLAEADNEASLVLNSQKT